MAFTAQANTIESTFKSNSKLIGELKEEVLEAVLSKYPCINNYGLTEKTTNITVDQVDQGVRDLYFTTTFKADFHYDYHPSTAEVRVQSVRFDGSNPTIDWTHVLAVEGSIICD